MSGTLSIDFGANVPGESQIAATGTTDATAYLLHKKVTVFATVVANGRALLPSSYASGTELTVLNRGVNALTVSAGSNQIETYGSVVAVAPGGQANFTSFDPPAAPPPRTWWLTAALLALFCGTAHAQPVVGPCIQQALGGCKLAGPLTVGGNITSQAVDSVLYCDQFASLAACYAALPSAGGKMILPPNATIVMSALLTIMKPNVTVECPSWATVIQRGPVLNNEMLQLLGAGDTIVNCTIDGNGIVNTVNEFADLDLAGPGVVGAHVQVIRTRALAVAVDGAGARLTGSTITGLGSAYPLVRSYGVWAINHVQVMIDHNTISATGIDALAVDGTGSQVIGNHVFGSYCYPGEGGGQIAVYPGYDGIVVAGNTIGQGCAINSSGLELNGDHIQITGNTIDDQYFLGAIADAGTGFNFTGNTIRNSSFWGPNARAAIQINPNISGVTIVGNRLIDDQGTPTQTYGVQVLAGTSDNVTITGNEMTGNQRGAITDAGTGLDQTISGNIGVDNVVPSVVSAAALAFPINPTFSLIGTTGVTSITGRPWTGRTVTIIPTGVVTFTAGNNIANALTTTANVPVVGVFDGAAWHLK